MPVIIIVADGDSVPVAAGHGARSAAGGDVVECSVAPVAEEPVAEGLAGGKRRESPSLDEIHVEQPVAVVVEHAGTAAGHLGKLAIGSEPVVEDESGESRGAGVVLESSWLVEELGGRGEGRPVGGSAAARSLASDSPEIGNRGDCRPRRSSAALIFGSPGFLSSRSTQYARASNPRPSASARRAISSAPFSS